MYLLQCHKTVSIEALATLMPYPIKFESRRRNIQRFLNLESSNKVSNQVADYFGTDQERTCPNVTGIT